MTKAQDLEASPSAAGARPRLHHRTVLWLHRQAERFDLVPTEFGSDHPVDPSDAEGVAAEWLRQGRLWADHNPEEMLAIKAGAAVLGLALLGLVVLVRSLPSHG